MAQFYSSYPNTAPPNLQFFPSAYGSVSGHTTPSQTYGGYITQPSVTPGFGMAGGGYGGFGSSVGSVSGRMGEQGGLRMGWLAAFGTEGYDGEPPLLEELGVNFDHILTKVGTTLMRVFGTCDSPWS